MILVDTNIFIEIFKGNTQIIAEIKKIGLENLGLSTVVLQELVFGAKNKIELNLIIRALTKHQIYYISEKISQLSEKFMIEYCLSHRLTITDSLIAATAVIHNLPLYTLNIKDFRYIPQLKLY